MFRRKSFLCSICIALFLLMMSGMAHATLTTIGTAGYDSDGSGTVDGDEWYKLIWDDDNNGNSVVWLDYTNGRETWVDQVAWAAGLGAELNINLYEGYTVTWEDDAWRLPTTVDGVCEWGWDGTTTCGYNITSSEMGHLFYDELGNLGYHDTSGNYPQFGYGLSKTGDFENLIAYFYYWSGTEYADFPFFVWSFNMDYGYLDFDDKAGYEYALAVRTGQVSVVPIPGTALLLSTGIVGLATAGRRKKRDV